MATRRHLEKLVKKERKFILLIIYFINIYIFFIDKEYWIGLDVMNKLTNRGDRPMQLRVKLERFSGEKATNYYDTFKIGNEVHI